MKYSSKQVLWPLGIVAAGIAVAVLWWTMAKQAAPLTESAASVPDMAAAASDPVAPVAPPGELQPVKIPAAAQPLAADQIGSAITAFLGSKAALTFFQLTDFPRKFVATVDNLGRSHAPPVAWPISPTEGRFTVQTFDGATVISSQWLALHAAGAAAGENPRWAGGRSLCAHVSRFAADLCRSRLPESPV